MRRPGDLTSTRELLVYTIPCACGQVLTGERRQEFQRVHCPGCQAEIFILPKSPLPPVSSIPPDQVVQQPSAASSGNTLLYLIPGLAAAVTLVILVVAARWLLTSREGLEERKTNLSGEEESSQAVYERTRTDAYKAWCSGEFALAQELAQAALRLESKLPTSDPRRRLELEQMAREIRVYAEQSHEPLEEILRQASGMKDKAWEATFRQRYQGRTFLLDVEMTRAPEGVLLRYHLDLPDEKVILDVSNLETLNLVPGEGPQRVLLGVALAGIRRERAGLWQVKLDPASTVLLTEQEPAAACCPALADPITRVLLQRQKALLNPGQKIGKN